jgi:sialic acid synthase SpsE/D-lyxose ketol-isomerase
MSIATPFDENSVDVIEEQDLDIIKIASCSFTDWPLLERVVCNDKPIIASTAGSSTKDIDHVISFFTNRSKRFAIMHCVGEYPTEDHKMHLSQIDYLRKRYPNVPIGFSTHESPENTDLIKMAIAKGATIFEKHVGLPTNEYPINAYSVTPVQLDAWLESAAYALMACGEGSNRLPVNDAERIGMQSLRRGMFAARRIEPGERITRDAFYLAFPPSDDQYTANDYSKYIEFTAVAAIDVDNSISSVNTTQTNTREQILTIAKQISRLLETANIIVPNGVELEISHHYGLDRFQEFGLSMLTIVNREYCKKLLVVLPGQTHPEQYHKKKEETFSVLFGQIELTLNNEKKVLNPGAVVTVLPEVRHAFCSLTGAVIEEISSTHFNDDSYYTDASINANKDRKTRLSYWMV